MRKVFAVVRRIFTQFALDKRTLALLFIAPLVMLWLLSVILGADTVGPRIATVNLPTEFQTELEDTDARIVNTNAEEAQELLESNDVSAVLSVDDAKVLQVELEGTDSTKSASVMACIAEALGNMQQKIMDDFKEEMTDRVDELKKEAEKKQEEVKAEVEAKKEEAKANIEQKKRELRNKIDSRIAKMKSQMSSQMKRFQTQLMKKLRALGVQLPDNFSLDIPMPNINLSGLNLDGIDIGDLDLDSIGMDDFDLDSLGIEEIDVDVEDRLPVKDSNTEYLHGNEDWRMLDRKSTRLNSSHCRISRMPSSA